MNVQDEQPNTQAGQMFTFMLHLYKTQIRKKPQSIMLHFKKVVIINVA